MQNTCQTVDIPFLSLDNAPRFQWATDCGTPLHISNPADFAGNPTDFDALPHNHQKGGTSFKPHANTQEQKEHAEKGNRRPIHPVRSGQIGPFRPFYFAVGSKSRMAAKKKIDDPLVRQNKGPEPFLVAFKTFGINFVLFN